MKGKHFNTDYCDKLFGFQLMQMKMQREIFIFSAVSYKQLLRQGSCTVNVCPMVSSKQLLSREAVRLMYALWSVPNSCSDKEAIRSARPSYFPNYCALDQFQ